MLMVQPRGGILDPDVPADAVRLCRVPIHGGKNSERGFFLRLEGELKAADFVASKIFPATYLARDAEGRIIAIADDALYVGEEEEEKMMDRVIAMLISVGQIA